MSRVPADSGSSDLKAGGFNPAEGRAGDSRTLMARAVRLLARRSMSEGQIRERLGSVPEADEGAIDQVVGRLKEKGLLDDRKFGEGYASYRASSKPMGRSRMARELAARKLDRHDIDAALDAVYAPGSEGDLIDKAIAKRVRTRGVPANDAEQRRLFAYLARLGFDYDLISSRISSLKRERERQRR